jgi:hypothetical protein
LTARSANCPNCGGSIEFRWAGAVQTTCPFCRSILVRHDLDLEKVGQVAEVPPVTSPIRIGAGGRFRDRVFEVVGRIVYEYERGAWSEWHLGFADGGSGWLSDAQGEYAVSFRNDKHGPLPPADQLQPGQQLNRGGTDFQVTTLTRAHYRAVEGELPFEYWDASDAVFVDLRAPDGRFSTLDYSDDEPALYDGEVVGWDNLHLWGLGDEAEAPRVAGGTGLNCPSCGSAIALRDPDNTVNVVCDACGAVVDAKSPAARVLQEYAAKVKVKPLIAMGAEGSLHGHPWQVIGFQQRTIRVEGKDYAWREYLLRNPQQGYRYLTEYDGHWSDVAPLRGVPKVTPGSTGGTAEYQGQSFRHFQTAVAQTSFVLGEFPWQVRVGDKVEAADYVAPPRMLSLEKTDDEETWSAGEHVAPEKVWDAFKLPGKPPAPRGVFATQPNPRAANARWFRRIFALCAVLLVGGCFARVGGSTGALVTQQAFTFAPGRPDSGAVASQEFNLGGRTSNVQVEIETTLDNGWGFFDVALIDAEHGTAKEVGREVSYYHGVEDGESWSEGDGKESVTIPQVPPGRYFLRIGAEGEAPFGYNVRVRRDVPNVIAFVVALVLLALPWLDAEIRSYKFEFDRWAESDHPMRSSSSSSSDDDD